MTYVAQIGFIILRIIVLKYPVVYDLPQNRHRGKGWIFVTSILEMAREAQGLLHEQGTRAAPLGPVLG